MSDLFGDTLDEHLEKLLGCVRSKQSESPLSKSEVLTVCYHTWVEDQFGYDTANYKSKMLSCSSVEYYNTTNVTQFVKFCCNV